MNLDGRFHGCFRHIKDIAKLVVFFLFFAFFNGKDAIFRQKSCFFGKNPNKLDILQVHFAIMSRLLNINNVCRSFPFSVTACIITKWQHRQISFAFHVNFCYLLFAIRGFLEFLFPVCFFCSFRMLIYTVYQQVTNIQQIIKKKITMTDQGIFSDTTGICTMRGWFTINNHPLIIYLPVYLIVIFFLKICRLFVSVWYTATLKRQKRQKEQNGNKKFRNPKMKTST